MDCLFCKNQVSSSREIDGREICQDCDIKHRIDDATEEVHDLVEQGWGSQSAADSIQKKYNLSDSQVDKVAWQCELYRERR